MKFITLGVVKGVMAGVLFVLVSLGGLVYLLHFLSKKEAQDPFEFAILAAALGGFLLVFEGSAAKDNKAWRMLKVAAKLYWAAALALVVLALMAPMLQTPIQNASAYWFLVVAGAIGLSIGAMAFALACTMVATLLWDL